MAERLFIVALLIVETAKLETDIEGAAPLRRGAVYLLQAGDRRAGISVAPLAFGGEQIELFVFGRQAQTALDDRARLVEAVGALPQAGQCADRIDIVGGEGKCRLQCRHRAAQIFLMEQRIGEVDMGLGKTGPERNGAAEGGHRIAKSVQALMHGAEIVVRLGQLRAQAQGGFQHIQCVVETSQFVQDKAQIGMRFRHIGAQLDGAPERGRGLLVIALAEIEIAEIGVRLGVIGPEL